MKIYNTLGHQLEDLVPLKDQSLRIYSCGPTVYDYIHIGNLSSYIMVDSLKRVIALNDFKLNHVMNFTDVDDKTIARSQQQYPGNDSLEALKELTQHYRQIFLSDMQVIGNDASSTTYVSAIANIPDIQKLITQLYHDKFAYIADDGIYFSISKYQESGKKYGQLTKIDAKNTAQQRIQNDEYDKDNVHDFALWKLQKGDEPAWQFDLDEHQLLGRPGWHIECSAMSTTNLGLPFDIHTGGVDLIFPHHENEIAQSTAGNESSLYAKYFMHNEHLLVEGRKMSKSLNNFYTLRDIIEKGYEPIAFRLMVLQTHYRKQINFSWDNLEAAQNRLNDFRLIADIKWQLINDKAPELNFADYKTAILKALSDDLNTPEALTIVSKVSSDIIENLVSPNQRSEFHQFLSFLDAGLGLSLSNRPDITNDQKQLITERQTARGLKNWDQADQIRQQLTDQAIELRDTSFGAIWSHVEPAQG